MASKNDFLLASVVDIQGAIRAVDAKSTAMLTLTLLPFAAFPRMVKYMEVIINNISIFGIVASIVFGILWFFAVVSLVRALAAVDNPVVHVTGATEMKGSFYVGGRYRIGILDVFKNRKSIRSSIDLMDYGRLTPNSDLEIEAELVFEQLKLAYIRDIKILRFQWGLRFSFFWLIVAVFLYLYGKFFCAT